MSQTPCAAVYVTGRVRREGLEIGLYVQDGQLKTMNARDERFRNLMIESPERVIGTYGPGATAEMVQADIDSMGLTKQVV